MNKRQEQFDHLQYRHSLAICREIDLKVVVSKHPENPYGVQLLQEAEARRVSLEDRLHSHWELNSGDDVYRVWRQAVKRNPNLTPLDVARMLGKHYEQKEARKNEGTQR